jgi:two-component system response regulator AtoC
MIGIKFATFIQNMMDIYQVIFSNSKEMSKIKVIIDEIAKTDIMILIRGEVGTGRELLARSIHLNSHRKNKPFVKVDCPLISKRSPLSEFFGFEKNLPKGDYFQRLGKVKSPDSGTILLKDIDELDISILAKLLQVFRGNTFSHLSNPLEGDRVKSASPRVLLTIKDGLEKSVMEGHYYDYLFPKIHFVSITVPPLRDRKEQIPSLSQYYFDFYKQKYGKEVSPFSSKLINDFKEYAWPGNIRELENMVKGIIIDGKEEGILQTLSDRKLHGEIGLGFHENSSKDPSTEMKLFTLKDVKKNAVQTAEAEIIRSTLQKTHWNRRQAAKLLDISYNTLLYKIQKYNLR